MPAAGWKARGPSTRTFSTRTASLGRQAVKGHAGLPGVGGVGSRNRAEVRGLEALESMGRGPCQGASITPARKFRAAAITLQAADAGDLPFARQRPDVALGSAKRKDIAGIITSLRIGFPSGRADLRHLKTCMGCRICTCLWHSERVTDVWRQGVSRALWQSVIHGASLVFCEHGLRGHRSRYNWKLPWSKTLGTPRGHHACCRLESKRTLSMDFPHEKLQRQ